MSDAEAKNNPEIPNGWYAVAWSKDLGVGEVKRLRYFGHDLVLFRGRSGEAKVLSAYCAHIGAHLAEGGRVMGESIRCPFHGWRYDGGTGDCVEIPYCERIPAKARVRAWEVSECNHMILVWHHAEQKPADWKVPVAPQFDDPNWSEPRTWELEIPVHIQDMAENNLDPVHFQVVHGMTGMGETQISYGEDGRYLRAESEHDRETPVGTFRLQLVRETWCIGLASVESQGIPDAGLYMFSSTSPIDRDTAMTRWALTATNNFIDVAGEEWFHQMTRGVMEDWRIWEHKVHRADPVFCEADTLLSEFRRWTRQFYSPAA